MTEALTRFHREKTMYDLAPRTLTVTKVGRVAPDMVRVTLTGDDLATFTSKGPSDHIKIFFPDPETGITHTDRQDPNANVLMRDFTPIPRMTEHGVELDLDFYTHADPGPAATWALAAQPGDTATTIGPRGSFGVPEDADHFVFFADETALPAVKRWVEMAPDTSGKTLLAMVGGDGSWVAEYVGSGIDVQIVGRSSEAALEAFSALELTIESTYVWAAGESRSLIPIRRHLRRTLGLPKEQVDVDGYWRKGVADFDHHAPIDPDDPSDD